MARSSAALKVVETHEPVPVLVGEAEDNRVWTVPFELIEGRCSSRLFDVVLARARRGDKPARDVKVFPRGDHLFAQIEFVSMVGGEKRWMLLQLDTRLRSIAF